MNYKLLVAAGLVASASHAALAAPAFNPGALNAELSSPRTPAVSVVADDVSLAPLRAPTSITVTGNGITATAKKLIVGTGSTGTAAAAPPGDPLFNGRQPAHSGVAQMTMDFGPAGAFVCSGALMQDRIHVLTAAHCVSDGAGTANPLTTTVRFNRSTNADLLVSSVATSNANVAVMQAQSYFVHPDYTGQVVDQNDIAIIRLTQAAPDWVQSYRISPVFNLSGNQFEVAGYGARGPGGAGGAQFGTGRLRSGENEWDFRFGDPYFGGFFEQPNPFRPGSTNFFGTAEISHSWVSDFDSPGGPFNPNNASCLLTGRDCNGGVGAREATTAGGDSGGPNFINGRLAGITSYGLSFGASFGDIAGSGLNSSFGEFAGVVPVNLHRDFIEASTGIAVPEPSSWAMLIAGFGLVGGTMRRRRAALA